MFPYKIEVALGNLSNLSCSIAGPSILCPPYIEEIRIICIELFNGHFLCHIPFQFLVDLDDQIALKINQKTGRS
jgi:hypothetical protein